LKEFFYASLTRCSKYTFQQVFFGNLASFPFGLQSKNCSSFFILGASAMTLSALEIHSLKQAPAVEGILPVVLSRWSPRAFAARDVTSADLKKIFEAARWSASSYNAQPWNFLIGRRNSLTYKKIFDTLVEFNQLWATAAPVLILGVANSNFTHNGNPNYHALYDLGQAAATLALQAASLGLSTHSMAGFDHDAARKAFEIPEDFVLGAVTALGYQGELSTLPTDHFREAEVTPRTRKSLSEFVLSAWGTSADLG
jgi:nitroreductase